MKQQKKWTIKQIIFEKEMKYDLEPLYINGFDPPKDKELLVKVLNEISENYILDELKDKSAKDIINESINDKSVKQTNITIRIFKHSVTVAPMNKCCQPKEKRFMFTTGGTKTYLEKGMKYMSYFIYRGLHIHKSYLDLSKEP